MPTECSCAEDAFNQAHRHGHKFGPRAPETHVSMGDAKLAPIFNPHASEGGVQVSNQYPRIESKIGAR